MRFAARISLIERDWGYADEQPFSCGPDLLDGPLICRMSASVHRRVQPSGAGRSPKGQQVPVRKKVLFRPLRQFRTYTFPSLSRCRRSSGGRSMISISSARVKHEVGQGSPAQRRR